MRLLPRKSDLRRMKRPDLVATLNACARHHRDEIARLEALGEGVRSPAQRAGLARHRQDLRTVQVQAFRARINIGGRGSA